jgi:NADP-dependent 3-hydroxy acid dehydrogenase YdfG
MEKWRHKVAVITGANSSVGAKIFEDFTKAGLTVVLLAKDVRTVKMSEKLPSTFYAYTCNCDISNGESIKAAFKWIESTLGSIHVLINNAGCNK